MRNRSGFGWFQLLEGILLVALGVFSLFSPGSMLTWVVVIYGIFAIITGISDIVFYVRSSRFTGFGPVVSLVSGIFSTMIGFMLLLNPGVGEIAITLLFPIWFLAHCIFRLSQLNYIRFEEGRGFYYFTLILNIIGIVLAITMFFRPFMSFMAIGYIAGVYLILLGIDTIVTALSNTGRRNPRR